MNFRILALRQLRQGRNDPPPFPSPSFIVISPSLWRGRMGCCCAKKKKKATSKKEAAAGSGGPSKSNSTSRKSAEATPGDPEFTPPDYPFDRLTEGKAEHTYEDEFNPTKLPQSGFYIDNGMWLNFIPTPRAMKWSLKYLCELLISSSPNIKWVAKANKTNSSLCCSFWVMGFHCHFCLPVSPVFLGVNKCFLMLKRALASCRFSMRDWSFSTSPSLLSPHGFFFACSPS